MIQYGDLPHHHTGPGCGKMLHGDDAWTTFGLCQPAVAHMTAHIRDNTSKWPCNVCGKRPSLVVVKPGSPHVWCLECF